MLIKLIGEGYSVPYTVTDVESAVGVADYLRSLSSRERMEAVSAFLETHAEADSTVYADLILSILDAIYDDVTAEELREYYSAKHSPAVVKAHANLDPAYLVRRLEERNLIVGKGDNISGTMIDRVRQMRELSKSQ